MNQSSLSELETLNPLIIKGNSALRLNLFRMVNPATVRAVDQTLSDSELNIGGKSDGNTVRYHLFPSTVPGAIHAQHRLDAAGGFTQQDRMIRDKRRTLDRAVQYSYQGAYVRKYIPDDIEVMEGERQVAPVRALINPNKLKQDYDDKIISIGYEYNFRTGDIFEWCNTGTYWLIYLQDMTELAYFRGDIRRCTYTIEWLDDEGNKHSTMAAVRGPVETKINYIQKHQISVDQPNYSLNILMPQNEETLAYFKRYSKFYLQDDSVCWRVEAIDWISTPGILQVVAVEYYANETEDDIENGLVGALKVEVIDPNKEREEGQEYIIQGETFIKPKKVYLYSVDTSVAGDWYLDRKNLPVKLTKVIDEHGIVDSHQIQLSWTKPISGQFNLWFGDANGPLFDYEKTIIVESLF